MHSPIQPLTVEELLNHAIRILVAGSRGYSNYDQFSEFMVMYMRSILADYGEDAPAPVFITGKARSGADDLIIRWCKEYGFRWCEYPADWDKHGKSAGYIRNRQMGQVATHLIVFWDSRSRGTRNMLEIAGMRFDGNGCRRHSVKTRIPVYLVLIHIPKDDNDAWQSQSSNPQHFS